MEILVSDKKGLELMLESIPRYPFPRRELEQYETPAHIAAHMLWHAFMNGDLYNRVVVDLGCGSGKLSFGSLLLGAQRVICVDIDDSCLEYGRKIMVKLKDYEKLASLLHRIIYITVDVNDLLIRDVDTVVMNPPFGVIPGNRGADMVFLRKALQIANNIYTIHKYSRGLENLIQEMSSQLGFNIAYRETLYFPIPMMYVTHRRKIYRVKIVFYVLKKESDKSG